MTEQTECPVIETPAAPRGRFYPRAAPEKVIDLLAALAQVLYQSGWSERGGYLLRDESGEVTGRTKWIPLAPWWAERPHPFNERQCAGILQKLLRGGRLTKLEHSCMMHMLEVADTITRGEQP